MIIFTILGIIFSICVLRLMKPLLTYNRLEFNMIYFLEVVKLLCFVILLIGEILR